MMTMYKLLLKSNIDNNKNGFWGPDGVVNHCSLANLEVANLSS